MGQCSDSLCAISYQFGNLRSRSPMEEKEIKKQLLKHKIMTKEEYEHMRHAIKVEHAKAEAKRAVMQAELKAQRAELDAQMADIKRQLSDLYRAQAAEIAVYQERLSALLEEYEANKEPSTTQEP